MTAAAYAPTLERWLRQLANEGRLPRTLAAYRADLDDTMIDVAGYLGLLADRAVLDDLEATARDGSVLRAFDALDLRAVTSDHLDEARAAYRTRPDPRYKTHPQRAPVERAPASVARRTSALRTFFAWCYDGRLLDADPAARLKAPKKRKRIPTALDKPVAERLLDEAGSAGARWPERDLVIVALALGCGLRLSEIAGLRVRDLLGRGPDALSVLGKGDKQRIVPCPPLVAEALADYLPSRSSRLESLGLGADTVVISSRPRPVRDRRGVEVAMTVEASRDTVAYVVERLLVHVLGYRPERVRVHALRHTFATLGLREGALSLRQLQAVLGHESLSTTQLYTEIADEELAVAMRLHPLGGRTG